MKTGLLGGVFDPIHNGHLNCAAQAASLFDLDRVYFIPTAVPPHKKRKGGASAEERFEMVRRAIRGEPRFKVSRAEMRHTAPSYTVDTVRRFVKRFGPEIHFIVGMDAFSEIRGWKDSAELLRSCHFIVVPRPGADVGKAARLLARSSHGKFTAAGKGRGGVGAVLRAAGSPYRIYLCGIPEMDVSSSAIRGRVRAGRSIKYLVPKAVEQYIMDKRLYIDAD